MRKPWIRAGERVVVRRRHLTVMPSLVGLKSLWIGYGFDNRDRATSPKVSSPGYHQGNHALLWVDKNSALSYNKS